MKTETTSRRLTRYERVIKLMNQVIEDKLTNKMMQAHHILTMMGEQHQQKTRLREEYIKQTR